MTLRIRSPQQSNQRCRGKHPHDVWYNGAEGYRIARREWKRDHSKAGRRLDKTAIGEEA